MHKQQQNLDFLLMCPSIINIKDKQPYKKCCIKVFDKSKNNDLKSEGDMTNSLQKQQFQSARQQWQKKTDSIQAIVGRLIADALLALRWLQKFKLKIKFQKSIYFNTSLGILVLLYNPIEGSIEQEKNFLKEKVIANIIKRYSHPSFNFHCEFFQEYFKQNLIQKCMNCDLSTLMKFLQPSLHIPSHPFFFVSNLLSKQTPTTFGNCNQLKSIGQLLKNLGLSFIQRNEKTKESSKFELFCFKESNDLEFRTKIMIKEIVSTKNPHKALLKIGCPLQQLFYANKKKQNKMIHSESNSTLLGQNIKFNRVKDFKFYQILCRYLDNDTGYNMMQVRLGYQQYGNWFQVDEFLSDQKYILTTFTQETIILPQEQQKIVLNRVSSNMQKYFVNFENFQLFMIKMKELLYLNAHFGKIIDQISNSQVWSDQFTQKQRIISLFQYQNFSKMLSFYKKLTKIMKIEKSI